MTLPEAAWPDTVTDGNEQDTTNDGAADTSLGQAADYNEHSSEIRELQRCLKYGGGALVNKTGGTLTCFRMVITAGDDATTNLPSATLATADDAGYRNLLGMLVMEKGGDVDTVADDEVGYFRAAGQVEGLDTSGFSAGDFLWLAASGTLSTTSIAGHPPVAQCVTSHASDGVIVLFCAGPLAHIHPQHLSGMLFDPISPAALAANTDDYNPTGLAAAGALRLTTDGGSFNLTGITAPAVNAEGRSLVVFNIHATAVITVKDEDASSVAANRFAIGADIAIGHDEGATFIYDATSARWRCAGARV